MTKLIFFFNLNLYVYLILVSRISASTTSVDIIPDGCDDLLKLFANETAKFTLCVISNARPVTVCEHCVNEYNKVLMTYENIQKLHNNNSEVDCLMVLTNIDRLQVVYASYSYVLDMWEKASCKLCLDGVVLNERTKQIIKREKLLEACISNHRNDTKNNSFCFGCKSEYDDLNSFYNTQKIDYEFCMDVVDMINNTQTDWRICHVSNYNSEWVLFVISFIVLLMPVVFYFINWLLSKERSNVLLFQNRWHERFTNSAASTSGYVVIS